MHRLPKLAALNWLRLASIRAGRDWKDLPTSIGMTQDSGRQSGLYGVCDSDGPSHTIVARARAVLDVLDAGTDVVFRLSTSGVWVQPVAGVLA